MWSKRPKSGGKGLRCKIAVARTKGIESWRTLLYCDRPARRYGQQVKAYWQEGQILDVGIIDCCQEHARRLQNQGVILTLIDRRLKGRKEGV